MYNGIQNGSLESSTKNELSAIKLAQKGDIAYNKQMDLNDDEEITLDEFKEYCDENNVSDADRNAMMKAMLNSKLIQEIAQKRKEVQQKEEMEKKAEEEDEKKKSEEESEETQEEETEEVNSMISLNYKKALKAYSSTSEEN